MNNDDQIYRKAKERGELTFTLVAHDITAPTLICEWIKMNIETASEEKLRDALEDALVMRRNISRRYPGRSNAQEKAPNFPFKIFK